MPVFMKKKKKRRPNEILECDFPLESVCLCYNGKKVQKSKEAGVKICQSSSLKMLSNSGIILLHWKNNTKRFKNSLNYLLNHCDAKWSVRHLC